MTVRKGESDDKSKVKMTLQNDEGEGGQVSGEGLILVLKMSANFAPVWDKYSVRMRNGESDERGNGESDKREREKVSTNDNASFIEENAREKIDVTHFCFCFVEG